MFYICNIIQKQIKMSATKTNEKTTTKGKLLRFGHNEKNVDVYVKDEGYGDFKFLTPKAREWANKNQIPNSLEYFGKSFCGMPVWYPGMDDGLYTCGIKRTKISQFVKAAINAGLNVESEMS